MEVPPRLLLCGVDGSSGGGDDMIAAAAVAPEYTTDWDACRRLLDDTASELVLLACGVALEVGN